MSKQKIHHTDHNTYSIDTDENKITKITQHSKNKKENMCLYNGGIYHPTVDHVTINCSASVLTSDPVKILNSFLLIHPKKDDVSIVGESKHKQKKTTHLLPLPDENVCDYNVHDIKFNIKLLNKNTIYYLYEVVDSEIINHYLDMNNIKLVIILRKMSTENTSETERYDNLTSYLHNSGKYDIIVCKRLNTSDHSKPTSETLLIHPTNRKKIKTFEGTNVDELGDFIQKNTTRLEYRIHGAEVCFIGTGTHNVPDKDVSTITYAPAGHGTMKIQPNFLCSRWDIFTNNYGYKSKLENAPGSCFRIIVTDHDNINEEQAKFISCIKQHAIETSDVNEILLVSLTNKDCLECLLADHSSEAPISYECSECYIKVGNVILIKRNDNDPSFL